MLPRHAVCVLTTLALAGALGAGTIEVSPVKALSQPDLAVATPHAALAKIRAAATVQLARYAADHDLARSWNLREQGGTVTMHRIVLVFHGGDVVMCEEVKS